MNISITHIDTATVLLNINGYTIITDPVLDDAGKLYHFGFGSLSKKISTPALHIHDIGNIDLVLLSHHQHQDNLDAAGKKLMGMAGKILSTKAAAHAIPHVFGLDNWETHPIHTEKVRGLKITAVPAQHHPWWLPEFFSGTVIGFVIEFDEQKNGALYISGDTVYFSGIEEIARHYKIDIAILHLGAVQFRYLTGWGRYTFNAQEAIKTAKLIQAQTVIPIHHAGWTHFKETTDAAKKIFAQSSLREKNLWLESGKEKVIENDY